MSTSIAQWLVALIFAISSDVHFHKLTGRDCWPNQNVFQVQCLEPLLIIVLPCRASIEIDQDFGTDDLLR
jgi:hypothetical protein